MPRADEWPAAAAAALSRDGDCSRHLGPVYDTAGGLCALARGPALRQRERSRSSFAGLGDRAVATFPKVACACPDSLPNSAPLPPVWLLPVGARGQHDPESLANARDTFLRLTTPSDSSSSCLMPATQRGTARPPRCSTRQPQDRRLSPGHSGGAPGKGPSSLQTPPPPSSRCSAPTLPPEWRQPFVCAACRRGPAGGRCGCSRGVPHDAQNRRRPPGRCLPQLVADPALG